MLDITLMIVGGVITLLFIDYCLRYYHAFNSRECPYCNRKMEYLGKTTDEDTGEETYTFYCPYCRNIENVSKDELLKEPQLW